MPKTKPKAIKPTIEPRKVADLKPAPYNPRRIESEHLAALRKSIERFGIAQLIVENRRTGTLVGGHQQLRALKELGVDETLVLVVDLDETEEKALNVGLNSPTLTGVFESSLETLLAEIKANDADLFEALRFNTFTDADFAKLVAEQDGKLGQFWSGMPEFEHEDKTAFRSIVVHFHDQAGVDDFAKRLGVESRLTPKARYLWWPEMVIETLADKRYAAVED
jgi:hypothetical protein